MYDDLTQRESQQLKAWKNSRKAIRKAIREKQIEKQLRQKALEYGALGKEGVIVLQNIASSLKEISDSLQSIEASFNTFYEE